MATIIAEGTSTLTNTGQNLLGGSLDPGVYFLAAVLAAHIGGSTARIAAYAEADNGGNFVLVDDTPIPATVGDWFQLGPVVLPFSAELHFECSAYVNDISIEFSVIQIAAIT